MSIVDKELQIKSRTTGFASPAESYVDKNWEMRQDFVSQKFTTDWKDIPSVFV